MQYLIKIFISALVIVAAVEIGKRSSILGALIASLPLTSLIAFIWLYQDTQSTEKVAELSMGIFWMIQPSFVFLLSLPFLLRKGVGFTLSLAISVFVTALTYGAYQWALRKWNIV